MTPEELESAFKELSEAIENDVPKWDDVFKTSYGDYDPSPKEIQKAQRESFRKFVNTLNGHTKKRGKR